MDVAGRGTCASRCGSSAGAPVFTIAAVACLGARHRRQHRDLHGHQRGPGAPAAVSRARSRWSWSGRRASRGTASGIRSPRPTSRTGGRRATCSSAWPALSDTQMNLAGGGEPVEVPVRVRHRRPISAAGADAEPRSDDVHRRGGRAGRRARWRSWAMASGSGASAAAADVVGRHDLARRSAVHRSSASCRRARGLSGRPSDAGPVDPLRHRPRARLSAERRPLHAGARTAPAGRHAATRPRRTSRRSPRRLEAGAPGFQPRLVGRTSGR